MDNIEISNLQPNFILDFVDNKKQINKEMKYIKGEITKITADITKLLPTT